MAESNTFWQYLEKVQCMDCISNVEMAKGGMVATTYNQDNRWGKINNLKRVKARSEANKYWTECRNANSEKKADVLTWGSFATLKSTSIYKTCAEIKQKD